MVGRQEAPSHDFFSMAYDHTYTRSAPLLLLIAGGLVYANSLNGDFIYDDIHSIVQNPDIRSLWPPYWLLPTDAVHEAVNSRPVASFTLAVNYAFGGLALPGYRLFNIAVHLLCGLALYGVVRRTAASAALAFTCALVPNMAQGHNNLGTALKVVGRLQEALAHYRRALAIDARQAGWWAELAGLLGEEQGAESAWQKALDLHPDQWLYAAGFADYLLSQGRPADAERIRSQVAATWQAPLPIRRYWWNEHISQGLQDIAASRWVRAERQFKWATRFVPSEPVGHYNLGMVYERTGEREAALAA